MLHPEDFVLPEPTQAQARYLEDAAAGKIVRLPTEAEKIGLYDDTAVTAHRRYLPEFIPGIAMSHWVACFESLKVDSLAVRAGV